MGVYTLTVGKGIIMPIKRFVYKYRKTLLKVAKRTSLLRKGTIDTYEVIDRTVKKLFGKKYSASQLGHDAFRSHNTSGRDIDIFSDSEHEVALEIVEKWKKKEYKLSEELENFTQYGCGDLMFIGVFEDLQGGEYSWGIDAPELIYGLTMFLPSLVEVYGKMIREDGKELEKSGQNPCIWTFATDCCCCT